MSVTYVFLRFVRWGNKDAGSHAAYPRGSTTLCGIRQAHGEQWRGARTLDCPDCLDRTAVLLDRAAGAANEALVVAR